MFYLLFIGGSATNDAGIGMVADLGFQFYNGANEILEPIRKSLVTISKIENGNLHIALNEVKFTVVCDVKNPLYGPNGAAYVYGGQKGASIEDIEALDLGLQNFSKQVSKYLKKEVAAIPGAGAAGGLGVGAVCFLNATIKSGIDFVMEQTGFDTLLKKGIDLIITGEGSVDKQTIEGKVIKGISERAIQNKIPFSIISGMVKDEELLLENLHPENIASIMELGVTKIDAIENAAQYINAIAYKLMHEFTQK